MIYVNDHWWWLIMISPDYRWIMFMIIVIDDDYSWLQMIYVYDNHDWWLTVVTCDVCLWQVWLMMTNRGYR